MHVINQIEATLKNLKNIPQTKFTVRLSFHYFLPLPCCSTCEFQCYLLQQEEKSIVIENYHHTVKEKLL